MGDKPRTIVWLAGAVLLVVGGRLTADALEKDWDPTLDPYVAFVEDTRGLDFQHPVDLVRTDIAATLGEMNDAFEADLPPNELGYDPEAEALRLLGLTGSITSLAEASGDVLEGGALAFYDHEQQAIFLPEGEITPLLELTIVHELTHALQDQHGLLGSAGVEPWPAVLTRTALIEGDASLVEQAWYETLSPSTQAELDAEAANGPKPPDGYLEAEFGAPYFLGPPLVTSLVAESGYDEIDRLLRSKSLGSDERLLDPSSLTAVPAIDATASIVDPAGNEWFDGWIGAFGWYRAIAPSAGPHAALEAVHGFDSSVFVTYDDGTAGRDGEICARFDVWFDSGPDAQEFVEAIAAWNTPTERVDGALRSVRFDICSPVGDPADQIDELNTPLIVSSWLAVIHAEDAPRAVVRCASVDRAAAVGFSDPAMIDWNQLALDVPAVLDRCTSG